MCVHGFCVNVNDNIRNYKCICDPGWTTAPDSPLCNVDIDECNSTTTHCSVSPEVSCINTPGSYVCGPCPTGFVGNGHFCTDINECEINNGGCSVTPTVACINTVGSYRCGSCPPGFVGNGKYCIASPTGGCPSPHCAPMAICSQTQGTVKCMCPYGYAGEGYGPNGCTMVPEIQCASNPCQNGGKCTNITGLVRYSCQCINGYVGKNCEMQASTPCSPNPCLNGGTCSIARNSQQQSICTCPNGFAGDRCESRAQSCGGVQKGLRGTVKFPPDGYVVLTGRKQCVWRIQLQDESKIINATFNRFEMLKTNGCRNDFLEIHDGKNTAAPLVGRFCGNEKPNGGHLLSTHYALYIWFRMENQSQDKGFTLDWTAIDPG